jgi:ATP-dependent Clp protease protease subunit
MEIQLREVLANTERMAQILAHHSGRPLDQVKRDIERDYYLTAEEALGYGLIDEILAPRRGLSGPMEKPALEELQLAASS